MPHEAVCCDAPCFALRCNWKCPQPYVAVEGADDFLDVGRTLLQRLRQQLHTQTEGGTPPHRATHTATGHTREEVWVEVALPLQSAKRAEDMAYEPDCG